MVAINTEESITREELEAEQFDDVTDDSTESTSEQELRDASLRIVVQRNDFLLPNLLDMLKTHRTLDVSPYYQRRARWDPRRKSRLIESFLVNIPVPPIFLYENEFARYEVMDGQQRVSAISEFFENQYPLRGLEILGSLNGKRFHDLPREIRAGLERRSLSAIILLKESAPSHELVALLRRYVFERLNTGAVRLNAQEVRNAVYSGPFNNLLLELSRNQLFTTLWDIPPKEPDENSEPSSKLSGNSLFRQMRDVELVLRVFGLLDPENMGKGMRSTLDNAMARYSKCSETELLVLEVQFLVALKLAYTVGGGDVFRLPTPRSTRGRPSASLFDGIMVALIRKLEQKSAIEIHAKQINQSIQEELKNPDFHRLVAGRANTREATLNRALYIENLIDSAISA